MKTHILWDHDGVLVETEPWYFEATRQCIKPLGIELNLDQYHADMVAGKSNWDSALEQGAADAEVRLHRARRDEMYQQFLREEDIEIANVEPVLARLAARFKMAIVTTAKKSDFELIHRYRNIVTHMEFVLANGDYDRSKPAPEPYQAALQKFAISADEAIVVEDSQRGLKSAVAAGIDCVIVANEFVSQQDFSTATYCVDDIIALECLLNTL